MTESWINVDSEEILNLKGPSCWPAPKDSELEQGDEVKSYFNFNWSWGGCFILVDRRGAFPIELSEVQRVGGWGRRLSEWWACGVLPVLFTGYVEKTPAKWKYPNCQQNRGVGVLFSSCVLSPAGTVLKCMVYSGWKDQFLSEPLLQVKLTWANRRDPGEHQGTPCFPLSLEGIQTVLVHGTSSAVPQDMMPISCTTPTWVGAWELMQYNVSGR